ncbi:MAG: toxin-antitoxin system YwqK family antitoxin [Cellulophaga baltica]
MKYILITLLITFFQVAICGQKVKIEKQDTREAMVTSPDSIVYLNIIKKSPKNLKLEDSKRYSWYMNRQIRSNFGAFSGNLVHGKYEVFDINGNLIKVGLYNVGIPVGLWKYYRVSGMLSKTELWDDGYLTTQKLFNSRGDFIKERSFNTDGKIKKEKEIKLNKTRFEKKEERTIKKKKRKESKLKEKKNKKDTSKQALKEKKKKKYFSKRNQDKKKIKQTETKEKNGRFTNMFDKMKTKFKKEKKISLSNEN